MNGLFRFALALCLVVGMAKPVFSQSRNTGEIRGTVAETSGAVVAGATVTLSNIDTGETKDFITNQDGIYDTVSTPAGNYNITFAAKGFKKVVLGPITLQVDVITENASLEVGAVSETVIVTEAGVPLLETETGHMGQFGSENDWRAASDRRRNHWQRLGELQYSAARRRRLSYGARVRGQRLLQRRRCHLHQRKPAELCELPAGRRRGSIAGKQQRGQHVVRGRLGGPSHDLFVLGGIRHRRRRIQPDHQERNQQLSRLGLRILAEHHSERSPLLPSDTVGGVPKRNGRHTCVTTSMAARSAVRSSRTSCSSSSLCDKIYNNGAAGATTGTTPTLAEIGMGTAYPGAYDFSAPDSRPSTIQPAVQLRVARAPHSRRKIRARLPA